MNRLAFGLALALVPATALAGGGGSGIPEAGGMGGGASAADARSLFANPAAAVGAGGTELSADVSLMMLTIDYQRAPDPTSGTTYPEAHSLNFSEVPCLAIRGDISHRALQDDTAGYGYGTPGGGHYRSGPRPTRGPTASPRRLGQDATVGLGLSITPMFGRQVHLASNSPGRYHLVNIDDATVYITPSIGFRPRSGWRFGAGPVLTVTRMSTREKVDLAPTLASLSPGGTPPPAETSLLEGSVDARNAMGESLAWTAGVLYDVGDVATLGASFISGSSVTVHGKSTVVPSHDFNLYSTGDFYLTQKLPPIVNLGGRYRPSGAVELSLEAQWVGWSVEKAYDVRITNSELHSTDQTTSDLLSITGLSQSQLVTGVLNKHEVVGRGWQNSGTIIGGVEYRWSPMRTRFELGYDRAAIPDRNLNPGNADFSSLVLGASSTYEPRDAHWKLGFAISQYVSPQRHVTKSSFASDNPASGGYAYPTGNGDYQAVLTRFAVNTAWLF